MGSLLKKLYNRVVFSGGKIRGLFWSLFISSGPGLIIMENCKLLSPDKIEVGKDVFINHNCSFFGGGGIKIGNNCIIAPYVSLITNNHIYMDLERPIDDQGYILKPINVEEGVWIGLGSIILPGVTLGKGSIVGAGSVVTKNVPPYSIFAGNPAKEIKTRLSEHNQLANKK